MQKTLKNLIEIRGIGLHSGKSANLRICPAAKNFGIVFKRVDITDRNNIIPASYLAVNDTDLCTRICNEVGVEVSTIEHLMAALSGTSVHNALIEIDGPEIPIMDGSAVPFVREILRTGLKDLDAPLRVIRILKDVSMTINGATASLSPAKNLEIDFMIEFKDKAIGRQHKSLNMANGAFIRELSNCRTFCRREDVEALHARGLGLGGSLENAIVVDDDVVLNPLGFRRDDECVRHKMLDVLGDLYLAGAPILGRYFGTRAGHHMTNQVLRRLFEQDDAWEWVICSPKDMHNLPGTDIKPSDFIF